MIRTKSFGRDRRSVRRWRGARTGVQKPILLDAGVSKKRTIGLVPDLDVCGPRENNRPDSSLNMRRAGHRSTSGCARPSQRPPPYSTTARYSEESGTRLVRLVRIVRFAIPHVFVSHAAGVKKEKGSVSTVEVECEAGCRVRCERASAYEDRGCQRPATSSPSFTRATGSRHKPDGVCAGREPLQE
jgi:hypothetical protein